MGTFTQFWIKTWRKLLRFTAQFISTLKGGEFILVSVLFILHAKMAIKATFRVIIARIYLFYSHLVAMHPNNRTRLIVLILTTQGNMLTWVSSPQCSPHQCAVWIIMCLYQSSPLCSRVLKVSCTLQGRCEINGFAEGGKRCWRTWKSDYDLSEDEFENTKQNKNKQKNTSSIKLNGEKNFVFE